MVTEKLIINGVDVPLVKGLGTVLTYSIKDIEQPDKRKASFSKTINLPSSKKTSELFNFIFEVNSDSTFNPNLKADAIYLIDDIAVFKGIIQLKKVNKLDNEGLDQIFTKAGFDWREPGCSMCLAMNADKLEPGERCASTSNRNFEGRQGRQGRTHLVSPIMAAAAAIAGHFVDVRDNN